MPPTLQAMAEGCASLVDEIARECGAVSDDVADVRHFAMVVRGNGEYKDGAPVVALERDEAPHSVILLRSMPMIPVFSVLLHPMFDADFPAATLDDGYAAVSSALWRRFGDATEDNGDSRSWTVGDWTISVGKRDDNVGVTMLNFIPREGPDPAKRELEGNFGLAHHALTSGFAWDVATRHELARALELPDFDPTDRDEDGDILLPSPYSSYRWVLAGDPDSPTRFRSLSVAFEELTPDDLDRAADFGTSYLGEPDWRDEDSVGWNHGAGEIAVQPNRARTILTMTVLPKG